MHPEMAYWWSSYLIELNKSLVLALTHMKGDNWGKMITTIPNNAEVR